MPKAEVTGRNPPAVAERRKQMNLWRGRKRAPVSEAEIAAKREQEAQRARQQAQRVRERVEQRIAALEQTIRDIDDQSGPDGPDDSAGAVRVFLPTRR